MNRKYVNCMLCGIYTSLLVTEISPIICHECEHKSLVHVPETRHEFINITPISVALSGAATTIFGAVKLL